MENYDCYIFAWDGEPSGGLNDLVACCDTIDEGMSQAEKLGALYDVVQLMRADGSGIE